MLGGPEDTVMQGTSQSLGIYTNYTHVIAETHFPREVSMHRGTWDWAPTTKSGSRPSTSGFINAPLALRILNHPGETWPSYQSRIRIASACTILPASSHEVDHKKSWCWRLNPRASTFGSAQCQLATFSDHSWANHPPLSPCAQRWVLGGCWEWALFHLISVRDADIKGRDSLISKAINYAS